MGKDYAREARSLHELIQRHKHSTGRALLDVACGTGKHLEELGQWYDTEGLDLDPGMLAIARQRCPDATLHQADMVDFGSSRRYDIITCLFGSIGYVKTVDRLRGTIHNLTNHLHPGGVLVIEPWLRPEDYQAGGVHALFVDEADLKIARMNISKRTGSLCVLEFRYLVATAQGVDHFVERHELGLFPDEAYQDAMATAGLAVQSYARGLSERGLHVGLKTAL